MKIRFVLLAALMLIAVGVDAQVFEKQGRKLEIEVVNDPPCPVKISVDSVTLDPNPETDKEKIDLRVENESKKPIRAYAMVSGGSRYPQVHTWIFPSAMFEPGQLAARGVWPNRQEYYYFFFDYILFADGTTCGRDAHRRSVRIDAYLQARIRAMQRLRELADDQGLADMAADHVNRAIAEGFNFNDKAGPPNPEVDRSFPNLAWAQVLIRVNGMQQRQREARELAKKLEPEIPRPDRPDR